MAETYIFACQRRIPEKWLPPFTPEEIDGEKVRLIQLPCSAKLSVVHMLRPFEKEAVGVMVMACNEKGCRSLEGSCRARVRVREANNVLDEVGLGPHRVIIRQSEGNAEEQYIGAIRELRAQMEKAGPDSAKGSDDR